MAIKKQAFVVFHWQVEHKLHLKLPKESSRAEQYGFVSLIMLRLLRSTSPQMKLISLEVSAISSCLHHVFLF